MLYFPDESSNVTWISDVRELDPNLTVLSCYSKYTANDEGFYITKLMKVMIISSIVQDAPQTKFMDWATTVLEIKISR